MNQLIQKTTWAMRLRHGAYAGALLAVGAGLGFGLAPQHAQAQNNQEALYSRSLAATCANCHGTDGHAQPGSAVPSLAGRPKDYIAQKMMAFKSGAQPATVMHQLAKGFSPAQIERLADYFSQQKP